MNQYMKAMCMYWYYSPWYYRTRLGINPWNPRNG